MAQRFHYLPISAPAVGAAGSTGSAAGLSGHSSGSSKQIVGASAPGGGAYALPSASSSAALSGDLAGNFSFADLGTAGAAASGRPGGGDGGGGGSAASAAGGALGEAATAGMAAGAYALSAFQARLQAGFGTMLGDKAAEMTALAQQRLDFTAIGTGFLGQGYGGLFATKPGGGS